MLVKQFRAIAWSCSLTDNRENQLSRCCRHQQQQCALIVNLSHCWCTEWAPLFQTGHQRQQQRRQSSWRQPLPDWATSTVNGICVLVSYLLSNCPLVKIADRRHSAFFLCKLVLNREVLFLLLHNQWALFFVPHVSLYTVQCTLGSCWQLFLFLFLSRSPICRQHSQRLSNFMSTKNSPVHASDWRSLTGSTTVYLQPCHTICTSVQQSI